MESFDGAVLTKFRLLVTVCIVIKKNSTWHLCPQQSHCKDWVYNHYSFQALWVTTEQNLGLYIPLWMWMLLHKLPISYATEPIAILKLSFAQQCKVWRRQLKGESGSGTQIRVNTFITLARVSCTRIALHAFITLMVKTAYHQLHSLNSPY